MDLPNDCIGCTGGHGGRNETRRGFLLHGVLGLCASILLCLSGCAFSSEEQVEADIVIHNGNIITVDEAFALAEAVAVLGEEIIAVGTTREIERYIGANTRVIDANGATVLPGLYDSHVHSYRASISEFDAPIPIFGSLVEAFEHIAREVEKRPAGGWIVLSRVYPTRLKEGRLPTRAELDAIAPNHPVHFNAGPVSMVNSKALEISRITRDTPNPPSGEIVRDPRSGEPTGLLRNAASLLRIVASTRQPSPEEHRQALKHLFALYNQQGITSIGERRSDPAAIDLFRELSRAGELTVRINCTRDIAPGVPVSGGHDQLDGLTPESALAYGPSGTGDDWVRIGPLKVFMDGGMLIGTAWMREPWGTGSTYQITDPHYRGSLTQRQEQLREFFLEAARRGWQLTAHCAGEAAMDELIDCYEFIHEHLDIRQRRFLVTHANFLSPNNLQRCQKLGIGADVQPAWLFKDGASLLKTLGENRMNWFLPLRTWLQSGLTVGGGSDHMIQLDSIESTNPWNPWLGMWIALTRQTELGGVHKPDERLSREEAIRLYTINNAYLHFEDERKGSLEPGKLADLIIVDRDIFSCPVDDLRETKVLFTMVGGRIVWDMTNGE